MLVDFQAVLQCRERALLAVHPLARPAGHAYRDDRLARMEVHALRVNHPGGMPHLAPEPQGELGPRRVIPAARFPDRARHPEVPRPVRHLGQLRPNLARREERRERLRCRL